MKYNLLMRYPAAYNDGKYQRKCYEEKIFYYMGCYQVMNGITSCLFYLKDKYVSDNVYTKEKKRITKLGQKG